MNKLRVMTGCSGYGGCEFALKKAEIPHVVVGFMEIDKFAIQCYEQNHCEMVGDYFNTEVLEPYNFGDMSKLDPSVLPDFDLFACGFPCQSFSIAGKRKGFEDTRGTLFFDILRILKIKKPRRVLLENVKGLVNHDCGRTFETIIWSLKKLGYDVKYKVLNSKEHGIPQNRERIWILCDLIGFEPFKTLFPRKERLELFVKDILEDVVDEKYYLSKKQINRLKDSHFNPEVAHTLTGGGNSGGNHSDMDGFKIADFRNDEGLRIRKDGISPCMSARKHSETDISTMSPIIHTLQPMCGDSSKGGTGPLNKNDGTTYCLDTGNSQAVQIFAMRGRGEENKQEAEFRKDGCSNCLTTCQKENYLKEINLWRRLTPTECFRLMGFLDDEINLDGLSDTQRYKLAGNGWEIVLVSKIFKTWLK